MPAIPLPQFADRDFVLTDFGGQAGGAFDNTAAIGRAIQACHDAGGGRFVVPAGRWLAGPVHFPSNVDLHLAPRRRAGVHG